MQVSGEVEERKNLQPNNTCHSNHGISMPTSIGTSIEVQARILCASK
jgi:hypothetical protein